jgi:predicted nuclease with TOPRIM domain
MDEDTLNAIIANQAAKIMDLEDDIENAEGKCGEIEAENEGLLDSCREIRKELETRCEQVKECQGYLQEIANHVEYSGPWSGLLAAVMKHRGE